MLPGYGFIHLTHCQWWGQIPGHTEQLVSRAPYPPRSCVVAQCAHMVSTSAERGLFCLQIKYKLSPFQTLRAALFRELNQDYFSFLFSHPTILFILHNIHRCLS